MWSFSSDVSACLPGGRLSSCLSRFAISFSQASALTASSWSGKVGADKGSTSFVLRRVETTCPAHHLSRRVRLSDHSPAHFPAVDTRIIQ